MLYSANYNLCYLSGVRKTMKCTCLFGFWPDYITSRRKGVAKRRKVVVMHWYILLMSVKCCYTPPPRADFQVLFSQPIQDLILFLFELLFIR